ncbi:DoxX family protein, partial [Nocardia gipuzkoensis]
LILTRSRRRAGIGLAALFVALLPANIYAAVCDIPLHGASVPPLWVRIPEQLLYIAVALWATRAAPERRTDRYGPKHAGAEPGSPEACP